MCYLCGGSLLELKRRDRSKDHCPPEDLYADEILKTHQNLNLLTLPTHVACNAEYKDDEEYFIAALLTHAHDTKPGAARLEQLKRAIAQRKETEWLARKVLREFKSYSKGGIVLPSGLLHQHFEVSRIWRVVWKIIRGLYFNRTGLLLPLVTGHRHLGIKAGAIPKSPYAGQIMKARSLGQVPAVFDYRFYSEPSRETDGALTNYCWVNRFWGAIYTMTVFSVQTPTPPPS